MSKNVKCEHLPNGKIRLIRDFGEVPRDFVCDGASIPRLGWRIFGHPYDKVHIKNGVRHDWDYTIGGDKAMRKEADRRYRRGIRADGQLLVLAWCEYFVLRLCGRSHFNYWQNSVRPAKQERKDTMKKLIAFAALAAAVAATADTVATILSGDPRDIGPGKVAAVAAVNKADSPTAFTVKSVLKAGDKAYTNTVVSATVTNTMLVSKADYIVPGAEYFTGGAGTTNAVIWAFVER